MQKLLLVLPFALAACAGGTTDVTEGSSDEAALSRKCGGADRVYGFDVSLHQGTVDWTKVGTARIQGQAPVFAAARVSDGTYTMDGPIFARNWRGMKAAGLVRGAYQFFRPEQDAHAQARVFIQALEAAGGFEPGIDLPPAVDIEVVEARYTHAVVSNAKIQAGVKLWLEDVEAALHVRPIVYSLAGVSYALGDAFSEYPLWIANFYQSCPRMPTGWTDWQIDQYDDKGKIPGVTGYADLNSFNGDREAFEEFVLASARPTATN